MSRSRARNTSDSTSQFPFLAVLLCTLGVLVLLLMAMASVQTEGARNRQQEAASSQQEASNHELTEEQQLQTQELREAQNDRDRQHAALERANSKMGRIERSIRDHQDRLESLRTAIGELNALERDHTADHEQANKRLEILQKRIAEKERDLKQMLEAEGLEPPSYAILPYEGPHGTRRRPIYIECLEDRVVIQPEQIELFSDDFHPQLGQGNPLAAALRAATDFLAEAGYRDKETPYPLVVVRPKGVGTYQAVMGALSRWDSPFGYEMVPAEWKLDFGLPNPDLASDMQLAVHNAQSSAAMKAARAPAVFNDSFDPFAVGPGVLATIEASAPLGGGHANANSFRTLALGTGNGSMSGISIDTARLASALEQRAQAHSGSADGGKGSGSLGGAGTGGIPGETLGGSPTGQDQADASNQAPNHAVSGAGAGQGEKGEKGGAASQVSMQEGTAVAGNAQNSGPPATGSSSSGTGNTASSAGLEPPTAEGQPGDKQQTATLATQTGPAGSQDVVGEAGAGDPAPNKKSNAGIGVERPIRVVVGRDRIVVGPRRATGAQGTEYVGGRTVKLESDPQLTSQQISKALQEHIGDWGMAGRDSYWRPVLMLQVEAGGERLAAHMASALRESGVEVQLPNPTRR